MTRVDSETVLFSTCRNWARQVQMTNQMAVRRRGSPPSYTCRLCISYDADALGYIRQHSPHPISSCETLIGLREFMPYFRAQAMDVAIIDLVWNGAWQSLKVAAAADAHEVNVAPHNFYGHLCTMMNAHFAAAVPNLRIMEIDIDRLPWDHELFTELPPIEDGHLVIPDSPGWGTEPNEDAVRARPAKGRSGLLHYRDKED